MLKEHPICLVLSADKRNFGILATLLASIARRTDRPLWVRCFCSGLSAESFEVPGLRVDFLEGGESELSHPHDCGFDVPRLARELPSWDRCLRLTANHLVLCDLAPWFAMELEDAIIAGVPTGRKVRDEWGSIEGGAGEWVEALEMPLVHSALLIHLKAIRDKGSEERLTAASAFFARKPLLALCAAAGGRILKVESKWHRPVDGFAPGEIAEQVVHWPGWPKPWEPDARTWGGEAWGAEKCSWEALRMGEWEKPVMLEVEPGTRLQASSLAKRGWKVFMVSSTHDRSKAAAAGGPLPESATWPDFRGLSPGDEIPERVQMVRFGAGAKDSGLAGKVTGAAGWLEQARWRPRHVVVCGPINPEEIVALGALGYREPVSVWRGDWPLGGADPEVLEGLGGIGVAHDADELDYFFQKHDGVPEWPAGRGEIPPSGIVSRLTIHAPGGGTTWEPVLTPLHRQWRCQMREEKMPGAESPSINLVFSTDQAALAAHATMLHSIVRRTKHPVHARGYCRGFLPESFHAGNLLVEFVRTDEDRGGSFPWWSNSCAFDRLGILTDHPEHWDRCWIMDHDQIATADLAEVYFDDFDGNLVMACSYGHKLRATCAIPDQITADGEHEFYMMGPILNLLAARKEGLWERLLERHRQIGSDEQKSLVAATGGRLKVLEKRWNRVVYLGNLDRDYRELFPSVKRPETDWFENYGVLHFTGGPKPWWAEEVEAKPKKKERVWFKEYATWAKLRRGDWAVPEGCRRLSVD